MQSVLWGTGGEAIQLPLVLPSWLLKGLEILSFEQNLMQNPKKVIHWLGVRNEFAMFKVRPKSVNSLTVLDTFISQSWNMLPLRYQYAYNRCIPHFRNLCNVKLNMLVSSIL